MSNISTNQDHGVMVAGGMFRVVVYKAILLVIFWMGKRLTVLDMIFLISRL